MPDPSPRSLKIVGEPISLTSKKNYRPLVLDILGDCRSSGEIVAFDHSCYTRMMIMMILGWWWWYTKMIIIPILTSATFSIHIVDWLSSVHFMLNFKFCNCMSLSAVQVIPEPRRRASEYGLGGRAPTRQTSRPCLKTESQCYPESNLKYEDTPA